MQGRLDHDDVVHLGLQSLKDGVELPAAATALVDDEFYLRLEGSERLEPQVEQDGLIRRGYALCPLVEEDEAVDETLMRRVEHVDLEVELVVVADDI